MIALPPLVLMPAGVYDFSAIKPVKVDDHTIRITLPEAQILGDFLETNESKDISLFNRTAGTV